MAEPTSEQVDGPADGATGTNGAPGTSGAGARRRRAALALLTLLALGLGAATAWFGLSVRKAQAVDERRDTISQVARQEAVNIATFDYRKPDESVNNILSLATGDFKDQYSQAADTIKKIAVENQASSTGDARAAGIVSASSGTAQVIVIVDQNSKNVKAPAGVPRYLRVQMGLRKVGGQWLVSDLALVQGGQAQG